MKITNDFNLPPVIVKAMENDPYYKGDGVDYSASELIAPIQQVILKHRHWEKLKEDASEGVWKLFGKSMHYILEKAGMKNNLSEERICMNLFGKKISGQFDFYTPEEILYDLKTTSVWSAVYGSRVDDWTKQLNIYAFLLHTAHFEVKGIRCVVVYRDWSAREFQNDKSGNYPKKAIEEVELKLWSVKEQQEFIEKRLKDFIIAENDEDSDLIECTPEQMWEKPTTWAVMKPDQKRAVRVLPTMEEAEVVQKETAKSFVQMRPGIKTRCESYCAVKDFCSQYKRTGGTDGNDVD